MITNEIIQQLESHWAVSAIKSAERKRGAEAAQNILLRSSVGEQIALNFKQRDTDYQLIEKLATAYEISAIEGLDALLYLVAGESGERLRNQCQAAAYKAFELRRVLPFPSDDQERIFHFLHIAALAYCGDRWSDLRRWMIDQKLDATIPLTESQSWELRVLGNLYAAWVCLFRKHGWNDLTNVANVIQKLRTEQTQFEPSTIEAAKKEKNPTAAIRLISLYHWAKATEMLSKYMLQGEPISIQSELDKHFESAHEAAIAAGDMSLEVIIRWLHAASKQMVNGSIWLVAQAVNSRVTSFVKSITRNRGMFELLPPQRIALQEQGLLDQANRAVVVNLPTSGGKTALAQFRILQALNQFDKSDGWVAYVAPTRALVAQVTRRLRNDFGLIKIRVEQLTGAVEIDSFEEDLLADGGEDSVKVVIATPEKLNYVIRNKKISRPLALVVMDEAHNMENDDRGLRIELLLATIKRDCPVANFLLLMPFVPNAKDIARWLAQDSGKSISLGSSAWTPNEVISGMFHAQEGAGRGEWSLEYETLITTPNVVNLKGSHRVGAVKPININLTKARSLTNQTAAMAKVFSSRGTSVAITDKIKNSWAMARILSNEFAAADNPSDEIKLVQKFLATEISPRFELIEFLSRGIGVHHAGLADEVRTLIEWLAERDQLKVLCATTTIAQGINFPVSSVFLSTPNRAYGKKMSKREYLNLVGRAGRMDQDSVGVVGVAAGNSPETIKVFLKEATEELVSRLVTLLDQIEKAGQLNNLSLLIQEDQWADFRSYIAHMWNETKNLGVLLSEAEQLLRNTYGYSILQSNNKDKAKAVALLDATKKYATQLAQHSENATLADATGFSPEGVRDALLHMNSLENKISLKDWQPASLFGAQSQSAMPQLIGIMMKIPELKRNLEELGGEGVNKRHIASIAHDWVMGHSIEAIAVKYFAEEGDSNLTEAITNACKGIYRTLANYGSWGLAALSKIPSSGLNFEEMSAEAKKAINNLPAMLYHGVFSEDAVLMRMNCVPRTIAENMGKAFAATELGAQRKKVGVAREFLRSLSEDDWKKNLPQASSITGSEMRTLWSTLSGEPLS